MTLKHIYLAVYALIHIAIRLCGGTQLMKLTKMFAVFKPGSLLKGFSNDILIKTTLENSLSFVNLIKTNPV